MYMCLAPVYLYSSSHRMRRPRKAILEFNSRLDSLKHAREFLVCEVIDHWQPKSTKIFTLSSTKQSRRASSVDLISFARDIFHHLQGMAARMPAPPPLSGEPKMIASGNLLPNMMCFCILIWSKIAPRISHNMPNMVYRVSL